MIAGERNDRAEGSGFDAGDDADAVEDLLPEIQDGRVFGILVGAQVHFHIEDTGGLEAGADLNEVVEAFEHESSADEEHEGERGFGDGQRATEAMLGARGSRGASAAFQSFLQFRAGGLERGYEPEGKGDENDHGGSEEEDAEVHANAHGLQRIGGQQISQAGDSPSSQDYSEDAAAECEHEVFRQHLTNDAAAAGTEREAQSDFPGAGGAAHEEEVGNVHAGNEQDEDDGAEEN